MRVLILGGSSEATALVAALAGRADLAVTLSLAGRTAAPSAQPVATRSGGFGGVDGLVAYLRREAVDLLVDATHPFATQIAAHARLAAQHVGCRWLKVSRPPWRAEPGDRWQEVGSMATAVDMLGRTPRRVFLTVGRLQLAPFLAAPWHRYLVRTIDPVDAAHGFADAEFITARGPFDVEDEVRLMEDRHIEILVTKNSGGTASASKLEAARRLKLPVVLVRRPPGIAELTVAEALAEIDAHRASLPRGV